MPPKVISGGDNPYDIHDAKLSSSATAHESSSVTAHEISNTYTTVVSRFLCQVVSTFLHNTVSSILGKVTPSAGTLRALYHVVNISGCFRR